MIQFLRSNWSIPKDNANICHSLTNFKDGLSRFFVFFDGLANDGVVHAFSCVLRNKSKMDGY